MAEPDRSVGRARWALDVHLELLSAVRLGTSRDGRTDADVRRTPRFDGDDLKSTLVVAGTTLAGLLRGHLADRLLGYGVAEPLAVAGGSAAPSTVPGERVARLFGQPGLASRLVVDDAVVEGVVGASADLPASELRGGLAVDRATGLALNGVTDAELVPAGASLVVHLELEVTHEDDEVGLLGDLALAVEGFEGAIRLGGRSRAGFGRLRTVAVQARRYALDDLSGWLDWLTRDPNLPPRPITPTTPVNVRAALAAAWPGAAALNSASPDDRRRRLVADVQLSVEELLIAGPADDVGGPEAVQLRSGGRQVLPGTTLRGALRARAGRILATLAPVGAEAAARALEEQVFGMAFLGTGRAAPDARASNLIVQEVPLLGGLDERLDRGPIDRLTGASLPGVRAQEQVVRRARARFAIELHNPTAAAAGLLLLALKDLVSGDLPLGSGAAVGRGGATGSVTVGGIPGWGGSVTFDGDLAIGDRDALDALETCVAALDERLVASAEDAQ